MRSLIPRIDREKVPQVTRLSHAGGRMVLLPMINGVFRLKRTGSENIPAEGPVLICSNHLSNVDPPILGGAALPRILYYMAKTELFAVPVFRWAIRSQGAFPIERGGADRTAMRVARSLLDRGEAVLMFPEGTRSRTGLLGRPHPGAGTLALHPGVTVIPAAIWGSQRRFGPVKVAIGEPIDLSDLTTGPRGARSRVAVERIMERIAALMPVVGGPVQEAPRALGNDG